MMNPELPIGIFDSGIGGLTVAAAIHRALPKEQIIYFGDTAHLPYGDKSAEAIKVYSLNIGKFLLSQNCKVIIIACNTASAHAYPILSEQLGSHVPIINVINPVVDFLTSAGCYRNVGVIGTKSTIQSGLYERQIRQADEAIKVSSLATPLLAPMIEEGYFDNSISHTVIHEYLSSPELQNIDSLILACTHYPLIEDEISEYYQGKVDIINTAKIVADHVQFRLSELNLLAIHPANGHHFYVSDYTDSFEESTRMFFGENISLQQLSI